MQGFELAALKFWNAANFRRRADPHRDQRYAMKCLLELTNSKFPAIKKRAEEAIRKQTQ